MGLRAVEHTTLSDFLSTATTYANDNVRLNLILGPLVTLWTRDQTNPGDQRTRNPEEAERPDADAQILVTVWDDEDLRLLFTKVGAGQSQLASPLAPPDVEKLAVPVLPTLIEHLLALPIFSVSKSPDSGPAFLRTLAGSRSLVLPFLAQWPHSSKSTPGFDIRACSLTTPPAITSVQLPEGHSVSLADFSTISSEEHDEIARLVIDFVTNHPTNPPALSLEQAREKAKVWMTPMWIYRAPLSTDSDGKDTKAVPVGFCNLGRPTPKTVAIRGVMVAQAARGRGIAERMVAHVARTYLVDARPEEHDPSFRNLSPTRHNVPTVFGRKDEVCLFVEEANDVARRVYKRVGFEESADRWGNWDLVGIEPGCW